MKKTALLTQCILLVIPLFVYSVSAQEFDFVLHNGNQSYRQSLTNPTEKNYLDQYMVLYAENLTKLYRGFANTFAVVGANLPSRGKPPSKSYAGLCLGAAFQDDVDWNDTGYRTMDQEGEGMFDISFFATLPTSRLFNIDSRGFWRNTDITLKLNSFAISITDARMHFSNIGIVVRKQVVREKSLLHRLVRFSGISLSAGALYSTASAREDDIYNGFENDIPNSSEPPEITVVDVPTNGTITMGAPANPDVPAYVYFPYIDFRHLSFQTGIEAYANLFYFLDLFAGANVALAPINKLYSDVHSDVNIKITDNQGLDSNYDGRMTIRGTTPGDHFMPMVVLGGQLNFGPVKLPIQIVASPKTKTTGIITGLHVAF